MNLYIQVQNNQPINHPITEENMQQIFSNFDPTNLPDGFVPFERVEAPTCGIYEVVEGPIYELVNGVYTDCWSVRPMTNDEKQAKITIAKKEPTFSTWTFDETVCAYVPPFPPPTTIIETDNLNSRDIRYVWDNTLMDWVLSQR